VLEELDKHKMTPELPVIVLTNIMDKPTIDKAKQLGARDYIIKTDLTPGEVLDKVMTYLA
jgi:PleD family two-component response regulator